MEHDFNTPQGFTSSTSSKFSEIQVNGNNFEEAIAKGLNILFGDDLNETFHDRNSESSWSLGNEFRNSHSVEKSSFVSRIRGSEINKSKSFGENVSLTSVLGNQSLQDKKHLSFENVDVDDEIFLPSDVGREMLLKDEEKHSGEFMYKNVVTSTPCTSWSIRTSKCFPDSSLEDIDDDDRSKYQRFTVDEFIGKQSEPLGSLSDNPFRQRVYFGCDASTPVSDRRTAFNFSQINEDVSLLNMTPRETMPLEPMLLYSIKKKDPINNHYYIGSTNYKNIQRLKLAEKMRGSACTDKSSIAFNCSKSIQNAAIVPLPSCTNASGFDETTLKYAMTHTNLEGLYDSEDSSTEQWIIQPQELTLEVKNKGSRLLLINNSEKVLKFKTTFDCKITNVCPISGIVQAKNKIGLRILVSRYLRGGLKQDLEDTITITCGKKEKTVYVKICKEPKSKRISRKDRSFICF